MQEENIKNTLEIVKAINEYIARKTKDLPYNINVIDELHASGIKLISLTRSVNSFVSKSSDLPIVLENIEYWKI